MDHNNSVCTPNVINSTFGGVNFTKPMINPNISSTNGNHIIQVSVHDTVNIFNFISGNLYCRLHQMSETQTSIVIIERFTMSLTFIPIVISGPVSILANPL